MGVLVGEGDGSTLGIAEGEDEIEGLTEGA